MLEIIKGLLGKVYKDEEVNIGVGRRFIDETVTVRIKGIVERQNDQMICPTVAIPLLPAIALFWEKAGIEKDKALTLLREALTQAMDDGLHKDAKIKARIDDVTAAITAVRKELIDQLPKMPRAGRVITKDLTVTVVPSIKEEPVEVA